MHKLLFELELVFALINILGWLKRMRPHIIISILSPNMNRGGFLPPTSLTFPKK